MTITQYVPGAAQFLPNSCLDSLFAQPSGLSASSASYPALDWRITRSTHLLSSAFSLFINPWTCSPSAHLFSYAFEILFSLWQVTAQGERLGHPWRLRLISNHGQIFERVAGLYFICSSFRQFFRKGLSLLIMGCWKTLAKYLSVVY